MSDKLEDVPVVHETPEALPEVAPKARCDKPSRARRTGFVFILTFVAYVTCVLFGVYGSGKIAEMVVDGLISLMMMTTLTYITAYSIDSSEILRRVGDRVGTRNQNTGSDNV